MYMMKNLTILDNIVFPAIESKKGNETRKEKVKRAEDLMRKLSIIDVADNDIKNMVNFVIGANKKDYHYIGANLEDLHIDYYFYNLVFYVNGYIVFLF